jgi:DNA adenine methylase
MDTKPAPFVKWLGGKRRVLNDLRKFFPTEFARYYEPFLGGGSVLFDVNPHSALVSDSNAELINTYNVVQNNIEELIALLAIHEENNSKEYYLHIRALDRELTFHTDNSAVSRAARFIYLNKTGFNGLHRVNKKGQNNVPFGSYEKPLILDEQKLRFLNTWLTDKNISFTTADYTNILTNINTANNFIYLDPPYIPASATSSFVGYDSNGFTLKDQLELRQMFDALDDAGNFVMLSNSDTEITREVYKNIHMHEISVQRSVGSNSASRVKVGELIVVGKTLLKHLQTND